ncbi:MAG: hypothetical protein JXB46_05620 [Candidatus Eisenbacteria bacterium]|nr:hypothetical protein [Candidatus Eisenbacteria bacterium]
MIASGKIAVIALAKVLVVALALVGMAVTAYADLSGSYVSLVEPQGAIVPGETYVYVFRIDRDLSSAEHVTEIDITFPPGMLPITYTMGFDELDPGRPTFLMWPYLEKASWWEQDTVSGGVHAGESMEFWVTVSTLSTLPDGAEGTIAWRIEGNQSSVNEGLVGVETPVGHGTWSQIKLLYR